MKIKCQKHFNYIKRYNQRDTYVLHGVKYINKNIYLVLERFPH